MIKQSALDKVILVQHSGPQFDSDYLQESDGDFNSDGDGNSDGDDNGAPHEDTVLTVNLPKNNIKVRDLFLLSF